MAAETIVERGLECDTVFAFTDIVAIGAMNRLRELGKRIPEDIAVASFSGTELSSMVYPQLTTVQPPLFDMGRISAELLQERIKNFDTPKRIVTLSAEIIMRASTGNQE